MQSKITKQLIDSLQPRPVPYEVNDPELRGFLVRVQPTGVKTFVVTYRLRTTGRRDRVTIGRSPVLSAQQARDEARKALGDVARGIDPKQATRQARHARQVLTLGEFIKDVYAPWLQGHRSSYQDALDRLESRFASFMGMPLPALTSWSVERWRADRLKAGTKPSTVNRDLNALRSLLTKAVDWEHLEAHPLRKLKPVKEECGNTVRWLSEAEEHALREALDAREARIRTERDSANAWRTERGYPLLPTIPKETFADYLKPMVLLSLNTGMRRGEVFKLAWDAVDLDHRLVQIKGVTAKSGKTRYIPLNGEATGCLSQWQRQAEPPPTGLVFPSGDGLPFTHVKRSWQALLRSAGITNFRWHDMRHHFASRLVMKGVDLNTVRELLGHADLAMTLRYAHLAPEFKAQAVARLDRAA